VPALLLAAVLAAADQQPTLLDRVEVSRVVVDARIVDGRGRAIRGLGREDLRVEVDGEAVPLETLDWVDASAPRPDAPRPPGPALARTIDAPGRLIVFLFQKGLESSRVRGLVGMTGRATGIVDGLGRGDRAAVLSYDSHLRLHADFTADRSLLRRALRHSVLFEWPPPRPPGAFPSLAAHLDARAARDAATPERALLVLGRALQALPGAKSILLFGWGLGRLAGGTVQMESDYPAARRALAKARATVFSIDVTDADHHTLEFGLKQVAEDTGGFYVKGHLFPAAAMTRLAGALSGYYVLAFERPAGRRGSHRVKVSLVGRGGTVLARPTYLD